MDKNLIIQLLKKHPDNIFIIKDIIPEDLVPEIQELNLQLTDRYSVMDETDFNALIKYNFFTGYRFFDEIYYGIKYLEGDHLVYDVNHTVAMLDIMAKHVDYHLLRNKLLASSITVDGFYNSNIDIQAYIKHKIPYPYELSHEIIISNKDVIQNACLFSHSLLNHYNDYNHNLNYIVSNNFDYDIFLKKVFSLNKTNTLSSILSMLVLLAEVDMEVDEYRQIDDLFNVSNLEIDNNLNLFFYRHFNQIYDLYPRSGNKYLNEIGIFLSDAIKRYLPKLDTYIQSLLSLQMDAKQANDIFQHYINPNNLSLSEFINTDILFFKPIDIPQIEIL